MFVSRESTFARVFRSGLVSLSTVLCLIYQPGCGTWIGNPKDGSQEPPRGTVSLAITGSGASALLNAGTVPIIGKAGNQIGLFQLSAAKLGLEGIRFKQDLEDVQNHDIFVGPYSVDLLTNSSLPSLSTVRLSPGAYKDIQLKTHKLESGQISGVADGDPLINNSIYVAGTYTPTGGSPIKVTLKLDVSEEFSLFKPSSALPGIEVNASGAINVIIAFRLNEWFDFSGLDYDFADLAGTDVVLDDSASAMNKSLRELIKDNIKGSANFGEDKDGDGALGKQEDNDESNDNEQDD